MPMKKDIGNLTERTDRASKSCSAYTPSQPYSLQQCLNSKVLPPFIHSGHFYSALSSPLLLRGTPDYSTDTVSEFQAEAHRQLQVQDLPKVPTWRLERESNPDLPVESHRLNQGATTSHNHNRLTLDLDPLACRFCFAQAPVHITLVPATSPL